jgi:hypothetical protein
MIMVRAETETGVREVVTTYREMISKYRAMQADQAEIEYLDSRWRLLSGDQQLAGVVLNDLLDAQERLADAEYDFAAAEASYNVSMINLNVITGMLLRTERVEFVDGSINSVPSLDIRTMPNAAPPMSSEPNLPPPELIPQEPLHVSQPATQGDVSVAPVAQPATAAPARESATPPVPMSGTGIPLFSRAPRDAAMPVIGSGAPEFKRRQADTGNPFTASGRAASSTEKR